MKQNIRPLKEIETETKEKVVYLHFYAILDCHKILKRNLLKEQFGGKKATKRGRV
jgi:hypothetical protein